MKRSILAIVFLISAQLIFGQSLPGQPDSTKQIMTVDASCGMCQLKMEGNDCALAVKIDNKTYYVDGTSIDAHGDAHDKDGFCKKIRKAQVQGEIVNNRFKASYFKLLPVTADAPKP